ncbi:MAG: hypothetical protein H6Q18_81 [Bacteroidetes bacterium]|nr:hypothetical protein [Bacteroidota bacterium]
MQFDSLAYRWLSNFCMKSKNSDKYSEDVNNQKIATADNSTSHN